MQNSFLRLLEPSYKITFSFISIMIIIEGVGQKNPDMSGQGRGKSGKALTSSQKMNYCLA